MNKALFCLIITPLFLMAGCCSQKKTEPMERICFDRHRQTQAFQAARQALYSMGFSIDKADKNKGIIITEPLRAAQIFEFWRKDNVGCKNTAEGNFKSLRRTARLELVSAEGKNCINCIVVKETLNLPEKKVNHSADAYKMFTDSSSMLQEFDIEEQRAEKMKWISGGRDVLLENKILENIKKELKGSYQ